MNIKYIQICLYLLSALLLAPLQAAAQPPDTSTTYTVVRHAEKATEAGADGVFDAKDPPLSATGQTRAAALARALHNSRLYAVYATPFKRTQNTGLPTATDHGLQLSSYAPNLAAAEFAAQLTAAAQPGAVLIVAHSNTAPEIAAALCHCQVPSLGESDFGDRFDVRVEKDGTARLAHLHF